MTTAVGMVPKSSAMYAANEMAKRKLSELNGGRTTAWVAFAAGGLSGYPEAFTCVVHVCCACRGWLAVLCLTRLCDSVTPFQVIKVRLQAREHLGRYTNSVQCFRQVGPRECATMTTSV